MCFNGILPFRGHRCLEKEARAVCGRNQHGLEANPTAWGFGRLDLEYRTNCTVVPERPRNDDPLGTWIGRGNRARSGLFDAATAPRSFHPGMTRGLGFFSSDNTDLAIQISPVGNAKWAYRRSPWAEDGHHGIGMTIALGYDG